MTTGTMIFFSGVGLLILTIILAIIFALKKPQYIPEKAAYDGGDSKRTQKLRSGYPTNRLTIRREPERQKAPGTDMLREDTERLTVEQTAQILETEVLNGTETLDHTQTEKLAAETAHLPEGTVLLRQVEETLPLCASSAAVDGETAVLEPSGQSGDTEEISGTTPLSGV